MRALERATDSTNDRLAFRWTGLTINLWTFPPVASVDSCKLNGIINSSKFPDSSEANGDSEPSGHQWQTRPIPVFRFLNEVNFPARKGIVCSLKSSSESYIVSVIQVRKACILSAAEAKYRAFFRSAFPTERSQRRTLCDTPVIGSHFSNFVQEMHMDPGVSLNHLISR
jgi:hypothetical protein